MTTENENKVGRPTVMTPEMVNKLEEVFAYGGTDREACFYAGISTQTLYDYQAKFPEFIERKASLKEKPILKARKTIVEGLDNAENARWYLERKVKSEFAVRQEFTGRNGKDLPTPILANVISSNDSNKENTEPDQES